MLRLAHLSDLHLLSLAGVHWTEFLNKRWTGAVNLLLNRGGKFPESVARTLLADLQKQQVDHVIISGDVSNLAFRGEFSLVKRVLAEGGLSPQQVSIVPGNHDYYTRQAATAGVFIEEMAPFITSETITGEPKASSANGAATFPFIRYRKNVAIIGLCTGRYSPPLLAWGNIGDEQLQRLRQLLKQAAESGLFRVLVLHHPPLPSHVKWDNRLLDADKLLEVLAEVGAELVIHGHLHRPLRQETPGPKGVVPVIGVGSGTWLSPHDQARRAQYHIYQIEEHKLTAVRKRRLNETGDNFVDVE